jgi:hypothetical protein
VATIEDAMKPVRKLDISEASSHHGKHLFGVNQSKTGPTNAQTTIANRAMTPRVRRHAIMVAGTTATNWPKGKKDDLLAMSFS